MKINIAIDGPSAAGKSTIAKKLAQLLGYIHLDTGAMYRCVALAATRQNIDSANIELLKEFLITLDISFDSFGHVFLNGEDVSMAIRTPENSIAASNISAILCVREDMVKRQQEFAFNKGIIMDGRDIGTVVLPDAELKIFMTASAKSRAVRRYKEEVLKNPNITIEEIEKDIQLRDYQDTTRINSPLRQAEDAILLDTSDMSIDEVVEAILQLYQQVIKKGV